MDQRSELIMSDMALGDDFFVGFDELDRLTSDLGYNGFSCLRERVRNITISNFD